MANPKKVSGPPEPVYIGESERIFRKPINFSSSGDNEAIPAAPRRRICVIGIILVAAGDVDVRLESGAGGRDLTGDISLAADGNGFVMPMAHPGLHWLECDRGVALNLNLSAAVQVGGCVVYYTDEA
jgi:hypothetical protein